MTPKKLEEMNYNELLDFLDKQITKRIEIEPNNSSEQIYTEIRRFFRIFALALNKVEAQATAGKALATAMLTTLADDKEDELILNLAEAAIVEKNKRVMGEN